jgi:hypothetical protein
VPMGVTVSASVISVTMPMTIQPSWLGPFCWID